MLGGENDDDEMGRKCVSTRGRKEEQCRVLMSVQGAFTAQYSSVWSGGCLDEQTDRAKGTGSWNQDAYDTEFDVAISWTKVR
jgi:hypothetical protein